MNRKAHLGLIPLLILALTPIGQPSCAQATIELYDVVFVAGETITFLDIADIEGSPDAKAKLAELSLGRDGLLAAQDVRRMIPPQVNAHVLGATIVEILPWTGAVTARDLLPAVQRKYEVLAGDSIEVSVDIADLDEPIAGGPSPPLRFLILGDKRLVPGSQVTSLECRDGGDKVQRFHINVEVTLVAQLAYPKRLIKRGQVIESEDIQVQSVNLSSTSPAGLVYQAQNLIGLAACRHLSPGAPIRWDQVRQPPAVHKGDAVEVLLDSDNFYIKMSAVALETGSMGEKIWVRLEDNGKRLRAVVVDADRVSLE